MTGLLMRYFVLRPAGTDSHARASRTAIQAYARAIAIEKPELARALEEWVAEERAKMVKPPTPTKK